MTSISAVGGSIIYISQSGDGTISYSGAVSGTISSWPVTLVNSDPTPTSYLKIFFNTNINLTGGTDRHFICGSTYIQIGNDELNTNGTQTVITIDGITNYPGLILNSTFSGTGYSNISIINLGVKVENGSTLSSGGGWIGQLFFAIGASNNVITNCYSTGNIPQSSGGIIGSTTFNASTEITINNCYSTGNINNYSGGIFGQDIVGKINVINSHSKGDIIGLNAGGIFGNNCSFIAGSIVFAQNCYSTGNILGSASGGIFASNSGKTNGSTITEKCYSLGTIQGTNSGGIYGSGAGTGGSATAVNCYSVGTIVGGGDRGIFGSSPGTITRTSCYAANGSWSDATAISNLTGVPSTSDIGTVWARTDGVNTPFKLITIGYSPYSRSLITTFSTSVQAPGETSAAIVAGHTFNILAINGSSPSTYPGITINSSTGVITIASTVISDTYSIVVYDYINPYAITTVEVEVNGQTIVIPSYCCPVTTNANFPVYEIKNNITDYKGMNYDAHNYGKKVFNSYSDYIQYKMARNYICN